ncbi:hypothetical protein ABZ468_36955 [Streptomyces sp. NPDC005708]|uniref:hypothetical protein n=1 Tax=Streptomyces sp. NPDC005708 TaxID=3154564 RepID=UPI0033C4A615
MKSLTTSAHIEPDSRLRVTAFADSADPFVSLRIGGDLVEIALIASPGTSGTLRNLAAAALEAADALDALNTNAPGVSA